MKKIILLTIFLSISFYGKGQDLADTDSCIYIQLCLLLDVSGSMQGLLDQAKSQIWSCWNHVENFEKEEKLHFPMEIICTKMMDMLNSFLVFLTILIH